MAEPGVIILAVYKPNLSLLRRQLESIMGQSIKDWQCVVGFDGPDEAALSFVRDVLGSDGRFRLLEFPNNAGIYHHFERLLHEVHLEAPWFALADQDDFWHERKLEVLIRTLDTEDTSGASCQANITLETGAVLGQTARHANSLVPLLLINEVTGCLSVFRPSVLEIALPFPPVSALAVHDHWLGVCAMAMRGFHFSRIVLHDYVQHDGNAIGEQKKLDVRAAMQRAIKGKVSWAEATSKPWEWRVTMAHALLARLETEAPQELEAIAHGSINVPLIVLMLRHAALRRVSVPVATALLLAAAQRANHQAVDAPSSEASSDGPRAEASHEDAIREELHGVQRGPRD